MDQNKINVLSEVFERIPDFFRELPLNSGIDERGPYFGKDFLFALWNHYAIMGWSILNTVRANKASLSLANIEEHSIAYETISFLEGDTLYGDVIEVLDADAEWQRKWGHGYGEVLATAGSVYSAGYSSFFGPSVHVCRYSPETNVLYVDAFTGIYVLYSTIINLVPVEVSFTIDADPGMQIQFEWIDGSGATHVTFNVTSGGKETFTYSTDSPATSVAIILRGSDQKYTLLDLQARSLSSTNSDDLRPIGDATRVTDEGIYTVKKVPAALRWIDEMMEARILDWKMLGPNWEFVVKRLLSTIWIAMVRPGWYNLERAYAALLFAPVAWATGRVIKSAADDPELGTRIRIEGSDVEIVMPWPEWAIPDWALEGKPLLYDVFWKIRDPGPIAAFSTVDSGQRLENRPAGWLAVDGQVWTVNDAVREGLINTGKLAILNADSEDYSIEEWWQDCKHLIVFNAPSFARSWGSRYVTWIFTERIRPIVLALRKITPPSYTPVVVPQHWKHTQYIIPMPYITLPAISDSGGGQLVVSKGTFMPDTFVPRLIKLNSKFRMLTPPIPVTLTPWSSGISEFRTQVSPYHGYVLRYAASQYSNFAITYIVHPE